MNLLKVIKYLYPDLEINKDFVLKDEGNGAFIQEWNADSPKPTDEELNGAWEQCKDIPDPAPPLSELEQLKKQQADLTFQLMLAGVI